MVDIKLTMNQQCGLEGQWDPSLHQEEYGQQAERGEHPLLSSDEASHAGPGSPV